MSLYSVLRTGVSGLNAQSTKLGTISDNIANSGTTGYKRAFTEFSALVIDAGQNSYTPGAVETAIRYDVSTAGAMSFTNSNTDLGIQGDGFFIVTDVNGDFKLTRAGSFVVDGSTGELVNSAGYTLMGYNIQSGQPPVLLNGFDGLVPIDTSVMNLDATPSATGTLTVNLDANAAVVLAADLPSANAPTASFTNVSSLTVFDRLGNEVILDLYFTKSGAAPDTYEVAVYNRADAGAGATSFPYTDTPGDADDGLLGTATLTFDTDGALVSVVPPSATDPFSIDIVVPDPDPTANSSTQALTLNLASTTQLAAPYQPLDVRVDGNAPARVDGIRIDPDGQVFAEYENGSSAPFFRIPLADVPSPDNLRPASGTVFEPTLASGDILQTFPTEGGAGSILAGALEQSNVDLGEELTEMVIAQRDYTANSRVFQTGFELLEILGNLGR